MECEKEDHVTGAPTIALLCNRATYHKSFNVNIFISRWEPREA